MNEQNIGVASRDAAKETPKAGFATEAWSFLKTLLAFLIAAFLLRASVVEAFKIPSLSMFPTLHVSDHILVSKFSYGLRLPFMTYTAVQYGMPKRGDIVVFTRPGDEHSLEDDARQDLITSLKLKMGIHSETNIIKRVIGLPGETVEVRDTKVFINNQPLDEPYARWQEGGLREGYFGPERVPEGRVFLLGDNRDRSKDSRFWDDPFLEVGRIKGRALIIYWSWESMSRLGTILR